MFIYAGFVFAIAILSLRQQGRIRQMLSPRMGTIDEAVRAAVFEGFAGEGSVPAASTK